MTERQRCPRRDEIDQRAEAGTPDHWRSDRTCSYCGSLHPDDFMRRVSAGETIGTTTKTYKAYLDAPWAKFYFQHLSVEQRQEFVRLLNAKVINTDFSWNPPPFFVSYD